MRKLAIVSLLFLLTACSSLGLAPASSFEERLAYAVSQNAAVRETAAVSVERKELSVDDAQRVLKITDEVRTALDAASLAACWPSLGRDPPSSVRRAPTDSRRTAGCVRSRQSREGSSHRCNQR